MAKDWLDKSFLEIIIVSGSPAGISQRSQEPGAPSPINFLVSVDGIYSIRDVINVLSASDDKLKALILDQESERLKGNALVVVNGVHFDLLQGMDTPIKAGDVIRLIPFLFGG